MLTRWCNCDCKIKMPVTPIPQGSIQASHLREELPYNLQVALAASNSKQGQQTSQVLHWYAVVSGVLHTTFTTAGQPKEPSTTSMAL